MKDHEGNVKQYIILSEAWYAEANRREGVTDEVTFGFYSPEGGTSGEMSVRWHELDSKKPCPCLKCYDDAWHALAQFKDVIDTMAEVDGERITPQQFCDLLKQHGFVDATPRKYEDSYPKRED